MFGTFTTFRQHVQVTVGDFLPGESTQVMLTAYDVNGALVAQSPAQSVTGGAQPVTLQAISPGTIPNIAFFLVQATDMNKYIWLDDLTFDNPTVQAPPDFTLGVASGGNYFWVAQGDTATETIPINRFNGSNGDITFSASGLPQGVSAVFVPDPVPGVASSTSLILTGAYDAPPIQSGTFSISADPLGNKAVGTQVRSAQLPINVLPAFSVWVNSGEVDLPPCTPVDSRGIYVNKNSPSVGDVTLGLRVPTSNGGSYPPPPGVQAIFNPPISPQGSEFTTHSLTLTVAPFSLSGDITLVVQGQGGGFVEQSQPFTLHEATAAISNVTPAAGRIPQLTISLPGTPVVIQGTGFCSPVQVQFGNALAAVEPDSVTPTEVRATVPALATTGPITLSGSGQSLTSSSAFAVDSYRNTGGFSFHNYIPHTTFDQLTAAFGSDQTEDQIPLCWPFDCTITFHDPGAILLLNFLKSFTDVQGGGGACFGIALSAQRLLSGQRARNDFPATWPVPAEGVNTNFAMDSPGGPSASLTAYINSQNTVQFSTEYLNDYFSQSYNNSFGNTSDVLLQIHNTIHDAIAAGEMPVVALRYGGFPPHGHVVTAYDIKDVSSNPIEYWINVYDPNDEYTLSEDSDNSGTTHQSNVNMSRIHIAADGTWSLQSTTDSGAPITGYINELIVTRPSSIPLNPTLPGSTAAQVLGNVGVTIFGSLGGANGPGLQTSQLSSRTTQLADSAGHTLFGADGKLNPDPASRLKATPFAVFAVQAAPAEAFLVAPKIGVITQSIAGTKVGPDTHIIAGAGMSARIDTEARPGVSDQIGFDPEGTVSFVTQGNRKPLTSAIVVRGKGVVETAVLGTTSFQGAKDEFSFDQARGVVVFHHAGYPTTFRLRLSSQGIGAPLVAFDSEGLQIGARETATFLPDNWQHLGTVTMSVRDAQGHERQQLLQNRLQTKPLGRLTDLDVDRVPGQARSRVLAVTSRLEQLPPDSQVSLVWTVSDQKGKVIAHSAQALSGAELNLGERSHRYVFSASAPGHYKARIDLLVGTIEGIIQVGQTSSLSHSFEID